MNIWTPDLRSPTTHGCHFCDCSSSQIYRVIRNYCGGFNNLSYTIHL